jgi:hypothetical protein
MEINLPERDQFQELFAPLADYISFQHYQELCHNPTGFKQAQTERPGPKEPGRHWCPEPFTRLALQVDGGLFPCCSDFGRRAPVGRFPQVSLAAAWNSPAAISLTEAGAAGREPCRQCYQ